MAIVKNDPFPGTDYSSYQKWDKVVLPSGEVFYAVPGNPAYVFDPVASNATGRKVFRRNPKEAIAADQLQREQQQKAIEQQQFNQSPLGQLLPVGASVAGLYAANKLANGGISLPSLPSLNLGGSAAPEVASNVDSAAQGFLGGSSGAAEGAYQIGTNADGSILMSDGSSLAADGAGISGSTILGGLTAAKGTYDTIKGFQQGGEGVRSGLTTAGAGVGTMLLPGLGTLGGAALGNLAGYGLQGKGIKNDLALLGAGSIGGPLGLIGAGGLIAARRLGFDPMKKTTKQIESDRWGGTGLAPEKYQEMIGKDYFAGTGGEQSRDEKFLTADAIRNNPDNYNNAPDWDTWSKDQQDTFLKRMLDAGKVREKKGGIYYDDDFAKQTAAEIRNPAPQVKGAAPMQVPGEVIDAAAQNAFKGPKWILRNGKTVKVA